MKNRRNVLIACMAVAMGLCINMFVFASGAETKLRVRLTSTAADPLASGSAKFEIGSRWNLTLPPDCRMIGRASGASMTGTTTLRRRPRPSMPGRGTCAA